MNITDIFWLMDAQIVRLEPFFPKSHGKPRVDDRRVLSGIIFINRNGLRWRDDEPCRAIGPSDNGECRLWAAQDALQPLETVER